MKCGIDLNKQYKRYEYIQQEKVLRDVDGANRPNEGRAARRAATAARCFTRF
jgi:hypothetical protein